jgi:hypothetical protein
MKASGAISMLPRSKSLPTARSPSGRRGRRRAAAGRDRPSGQVAGQEAQALAGLDRRAGEHDALDPLALEGVDRAGDGEIGLAGAGRADAEGDVVSWMCAGSRPGAACGRAARSCASSAPARAAPPRPCWPSRSGRAGCRRATDPCRRARRNACSAISPRSTCALWPCSVKCSHAAAHGDVEGVLDLAQVLVERAAQLGQAGVIHRLEEDFQARLKPAPFRIPG